jgi:hypothetical protein
MKQDRERSVPWFLGELASGLVRGLSLAPHPQEPCLHRVASYRLWGGNGLVAPDRLNRFDRMDPDLWPPGLARAGRVRSSFPKASLAGEKTRMVCL